MLGLGKYFDSPFDEIVSGMIIFHAACYDTYRNGDVIRHITFFMRYIPVPYTFKQPLRDNACAAFVCFGRIMINSSPL